MPTAQVVTIIHKTGLNIIESEVLVLPVHSRETRLVSFETRLISFLSRRVSRETRRVSRDGGNLLLSGTVTLSPSYTKQFSSSIDLLAWPVQCNGKVVVESFRKKYSTKPRIAQALTWGLGTNTLPSISSANL